MKKILFSFLAIAMLSTAAFAAKPKATKKKHAVKKECPANCPKTMDCFKRGS